VAPTLERRDRERLETRTLILDAARELFARDGYDAVTMRAIAKRIEYTPTAIYFHFKDKLALLRELCDADFGALARRFHGIARVADPVERLRQIGMAYVEFGLDHPNHYRLMFMTPHPPLDPAESGLEKGNPEQDAYAFLKATLAEAIAAGRLRPEFHDVDRAAQTAWAGAHGIVSLHIAKCNDGWIDWRPPHETARLLIDAMIRGMLVAAED
jgi:AcrR family transcriptional regulator